jgi:hypothetical protein
MIRVLGALYAGADYFNAIQASAFYAGKGFTETQINAIQDAIEAYMDSNSKGVIS